MRIVTVILKFYIVFIFDKGGWSLVILNRIVDELFDINDKSSNEKIKKNSNCHINNIYISIYNDLTHWYVNEIYDSFYDLITIVWGWKRIVEAYTYL